MDYCGNCGIYVGFMIYDLCNKYGFSMTHMGSMWDFVVVRGTFQRIYHKPLPGDDSLYIYIWEFHQENMGIHLDIQ